MRRTIALLAKKATQTNKNSLLTLRNTQRSIPVNTPLLRRRTEHVLSQLNLSNYSLDVWLTTDSNVAKLNHQYRHVDRPTDVLSFPFQSLTPPSPSTSPQDRPLPPPVHEIRDLGQIVISVPYVARYVEQQTKDEQVSEQKSMLPHPPSQSPPPLKAESTSVAAASKLTVDERLKVLMVHGICHLLGYDHEVDSEAAVMQAEEDRLLQLLQQAEEQENSTDDNSIKKN